MEAGIIAADLWQSKDSAVAGVGSSNLVHMQVWALVS